MPAKPVPRKPKPSSSESVGTLNMRLRASDTRNVSTAVNTVVYVHGINNKPEEHILCCQWDRALFDTPMGDRTRMAYWVFRDRYGPPLDGTCEGADGVRMRTADSGYGIRGVSAINALGAADFEEKPTPEGRKFLEEVEASLQNSMPPSRSPDSRVRDFDTFFGGGSNLLFRLVGNLVLRDVHDFFFNEARANAMLEALDRCIRPGGGPFVIVSHSQGTMIALRYLLERAPRDLEVPLLVTLGSPLGLPPVRSRFKKWFKKDKLPFPPSVAKWVNVANKGDVVCLDTNLTKDIEPLRGVLAGRQLQNHEIDSPNADLREDKHSATGYLKASQTREAVTLATGKDFAGPVGLRVISHDVVAEYERADRAERTRVLIELHLDPKAPEKNTAELAERIVSELDAKGEHVKEMNVERLKRFVAADLTREELERLRTGYSHLNIHRIWRNAQKKALMDRSIGVVHAGAAQRAYLADGTDITWAILDTGIDANHPHFHMHENVTQVWDCTKPGNAPTLIDTNVERDTNGHGSHVAGIIAGEYQSGDPPMVAMAPRTKLVAFKVLKDDGTGHDSNIIKALDKIADINEEANRLVIQGVNLSLGGDFDPSVYACGFTPLCNELHRLWRQGVVVVIAAGNEGFENLRTASGGTRQTNLDLSIGDPGNLEQAITVGSVHRSEPHNFGISFFSSRGPTADGRLKPDVVAPGERIRSVRSGKSTGGTAQMYVQMSGTSMAAPHVSGVIAAFLSVRREFIGYPDRVKSLMLAHCTDLGRDRYLQGAGIPNLVKMLAAT